MENLLTLKIVATLLTALVSVDVRGSSGSNYWPAGRGPDNTGYDDKLYFSRSNQATISCYQTQTGKANFTEQRLEGLTEFYASAVGVAGRVYWVSMNYS